MAEPKKNKNEELTPEQKCQQEREKLERQLYQLQFELIRLRRENTMLQEQLLVRDVSAKYPDMIGGPRPQPTDDNKS